MNTGGRGQRWIGRRWGTCANGLGGRKDGGNSGGLAGVIGQADHNFRLRRRPHEKRFSAIVGERGGANGSAWSAGPGLAAGDQHQCAQGQDPQNQRSAGRPADDLPGPLIYHPTIYISKHNYAPIIIYRWSLNPLPTRAL